MLDYGIPKKQGLSLLDIPIRTMRDAKLKEKSTSGTCQLLGRSLVSRSSKKQNSVALSTA
jgi:hypothetical protein